MRLTNTNNLIEFLATRILVLILILPMAACQADQSGYNKAIDGVLIEQDTNKPIKDAFIVARWTHYGTDGLGSRTMCVHMEIVKTDAQGKYQVPSVFIGALIGRVVRRVFAYMPGYEELRKPILTAEEYAVFERQKFMRKLDVSVTERLQQLQDFSGLGCEGEERHGQALVRLYRAMQMEASEISLKGDRDPAADSLRYQADRLISEGKAKDDYSPGYKSR
jgi:hypothetical protein